MATADRCRTDTVLPVSRPTAGFIASVVTSDTPWCADGRHLWLIRAEVGQQINLTLYDFFASASTGAVNPHSSWSPSTASTDVDDAAWAIRRPIQKRNMSSGLLSDYQGESSEQKSSENRFSRNDLWRTRKMRSKGDFLIITWFLFDHLM
jgi:hypothetical protein